MVVGSALVACNQQPKEESLPARAISDTFEDGPSWAKNANIYEVNVRQYSPEGTFAAFAGHLPRLQAMEVDILWFMPVFPISERKRKGSLGSYYAVSDFTAINPAYGTLEEFKELVDRIHEMGMRVVLDWVPNHTGWDHRWITDHPDWYTRNEQGEITDPLNEETGKPHGWTDVADLNYDNSDLRQAMITDMLFWVKEVGIDGFRCDVAGEVPLDFWETSIAALRAVNPDLFMLAEAEKPELRNTGLFTASYGWSFHHLMNDIAQGKKPASAIGEWLKVDRERFLRGYHMHFITNHDENSWNGTVEERLGPAADAMAVLAFTLQGMPLIYSGQEAGLRKRLEFFEKDSIDWGNYARQGFYRTLLDLKHRNRALWNGKWGGLAVQLPTSNAEDIFAYYREKDGDKLIVILNLSGTYQDIVIDDPELAGDYTNVFGNSTMTVTGNMMMKLNPWDYLVLSNK